MALSDNPFIGIDIKTLIDLQTAYKQAMKDVMTAGQSYSFPGRSFTRVNIGELRDTLTNINVAIRRAQGKGGARQVVYGVFRQPDVSGLSPGAGQMPSGLFYLPSGKNPQNSILILPQVDGVVCGCVWKDGEQTAGNFTPDSIGPTGQSGYQTLKQQLDTVQAANVTRAGLGLHPLAIRLEIGVGDTWDYNGGAKPATWLRPLIQADSTVGKYFWWSNNASIADGVANGTTTWVSATAQFISQDVGKSITSAKIIGGTTIQSVTNSTTVILSQAATGSGTNQQFNILNRCMENPVFWNPTFRTRVLSFVAQVYQYCLTHAAFKTIYAVPVPYASASSADWNLGAVSGSNDGCPDPYGSATDSVHRWQNVLLADGTFPTLADALIDTGKKWYDGFAVACPTWILFNSIGRLASVAGAPWINHTGDSIGNNIFHAVSDYAYAKYPAMIGVAKWNLNGFGSVGGVSDPNNAWYDLFQFPGFKFAQATWSCFQAGDGCPDPNYQCKRMNSGSGSPCTEATPTFVAAINSAYMLGCSQAEMYEKDIQNLGAGNGDPLPGPIVNAVQFGHDTLYRGPWS